MSLEDRIREIGLELYSSVNGAPPIFDKKKWIGKIMDWAMKDEEFKSSLFRYIDVLPSLKSDALIVRLLKEYFSGMENIPLIIRQGIEHASKSILPYAAGSAIRAGVKSLAREFIAGSDAEEIMRSLGDLWDIGSAISIDLLGEDVLSDKEAKEYAERYLNLIDILQLGCESQRPEIAKWKESSMLEKNDRSEIPRLDISFKASSFYSQLDPIDWEGSIEKTKESLRPVIAKAKEKDASICFDMEHYYYKDLIIEIFKNILDEFEDHHFAGIALQAYLKDTKDDLLRLIEWAKERKRIILIRLVKGAYWDYEIVINRQKGWPVPVFTNKEDTDRNFEELAEILLENSDFIRPAIATHNIRSISHAIAAAESLKLPKAAIEFQMLYGMGEPLRKRLKEIGYRVRVYAPVGELIPGMAYLVRRLLENTSNISFLREFFAEKKPFEEIIKSPSQKIERRINEHIDVFRNEPSLDFSKSENRDKMKIALEKIRGEFNGKYPLYLGGEEVFTNKEILSLNPADITEVVGRISRAGRDEAENAIAGAKKALEMWRNTKSEERVDYLFKAAEEMRKQRFELAALEIFEAGKTWKDADGDITEAIDYLEYYGREMIRLGKHVRLGDYPGEENEYFYEPRGIGIVISPWNFPLAISAGMTSAGIVTGNCIIFKPSGLSSVTGWRLVDAFKKAGLPPGVLQFLPGPGSEVEEYLVSHKDIDFIAFTGSKEVGLRIVKIAGETKQGQRNVKKVIAEMGGKNAIIVDETAELDDTIRGIIESSMGYQGQKCSACSRVIVVGEIFNEFCERLKNAMGSITMGPPENPGNLIGPVIDENAFRKIHGYIEKGRSEGKEFFVGRSDLKGNFIGPVIFTDIDRSSSLAREEIFGPVLSVMRAKDIDEAIEIANDTEYALTGGIFSRSPANIKKVRENFSAGNFYINRKITGALVGRQPFGGFGMSGVGSKTGGPDYLLQFMNSKSISENTLRRGFAPIISAPPF